jgi:hypothetical protein
MDQIVTRSWDACGSYNKSLCSAITLPVTPRQVNCILRQEIASSLVMISLCCNKTVYTCLMSRLGCYDYFIIVWGWEYHGFRRSSRLITCSFVWHFSDVQANKSCLQQSQVTLHALPLSFTSETSLRTHWTLHWCFGFATKTKESSSFTSSSHSSCASSVKIRLDDSSTARPVSPKTGIVSTRVPFPLFAFQLFQNHINCGHSGDTTKAEHCIAMFVWSIASSIARADSSRNPWKSSLIARSEMLD